jgi:hypothetical protein
VDEGLDLPCLRDLNALELVLHFGVDTFGDKLGLFALVALPIECKQKLANLL